MDIHKFGVVGPNGTITYSKRRSKRYVVPDRNHTWKAGYRSYVRWVIDFKIKED